MPEDNQLATTLEAKLARAAELKAEISKLEPLKKELDEIRVDLDYEMAAMKSKRTEPVAGYYGLVVESKSMQITDEQSLAEWLDANTMDPEAYYIHKIDPRGITTLVEERMRDYGEFVPGVEEVVTRRVDIRKATK